MDQTTIALKVGETATLRATVKPSDANNQNIAFSSSDDAISTVTPKAGKVTAISIGTAQITVTTDNGNFKSECTVTVTA